MRKSNLLRLFAVLMLLVLPVSAAQKGSLLIQDIDHPVTLYRVADAQGNLSEDFSGYGRIPEGETTAKAARELQAYAADKGIKGQEMTPVQGEACYPELEEGLYLVCSLHTPGEFAPFLLSIPTTLNGQTVYHVEAKPKLEETPPETETTVPAETKPSDREIPQTGTSVIPKYALLILGSVLTLVGLYQVLTGREETGYD